MSLKKNLITIFLSILAGLIFIFFWPFFNLEMEEIRIIPPQIISIAEKEIFTPPPLRMFERKEDSESFLTIEGIIDWTNIERERNNLAPLKENIKLRDMAKLKVEDMFAKQYFEHESPQGEEVRDLAEKVTYQFLTVGENLAMGNFLNDKELVQSWMESPGHRENILTKNYQEIGVFILKDNFNGRSVWIAVQHFGIPLSACPFPDESTKKNIEEKGSELDTLEKEIISLQKELERIRPKWGPYYQSKIDEYNKLVDRYNNLLLENKKIIEEYNREVRDFNNCISSLK